MIVQGSNTLTELAQLLREQPDTEVTRCLETGEDGEPVWAIIAVCGAPRTRRVLREIARLESEWDREDGREVRRCRVCGCTDDDCSGCIERTGKPCYWVEEDLCSACCPGSIANRCPQCGEQLVTANTNGTEEGLDTYCEECGWPDEVRGNPTGGQEG
jgi:hypothetical protein